MLAIVYAQDLPGRDDSAVQQAFGVAVASVGLASFALVIALVEQARPAQWTQRRGPSSRQPCLAVRHRARLALWSGPSSSGAILLTLRALQPLRC